MYVGSLIEDLGMSDFVNQTPELSLFTVVSQATWNTNSYKELVGKTAKAASLFSSFYTILIQY